GGPGEHLGPAAEPDDSDFHLVRCHCAAAFQRVARMERSEMRGEMKPDLSRIALRSIRATDRTTRPLGSKLPARASLPAPRVNAMRRGWEYWARQAGCDELLAD